MENYDLLNNDLQVSSSAQSFLNETAKWGKFLGIMGFILCGFIVIISFFAPAIMMSMPPYNSMASELTSGIIAGITIFYWLFAALLFFPAFYLYKFAVKMKMSLNTLSQNEFDESLKNLKSMFKFYGILTVIMLSFYVLVFVIAMIAGMLM